MKSYYHKGILIKVSSDKPYSFQDRGKIGYYYFINRKGQEIIKSTKEEIEKEVDEDLKPPFRFFEDREIGF